jgi:hypothetical protein
VADVQCSCSAWHIFHPNRRAALAGEEADQQAAASLTVKMPRYCWITYSLAVTAAATVAPVHTQCNLPEISRLAGDGWVLLSNTGAHAAICGTMGTGNEGPSCSSTHLKAWYKGFVPMFKVGKQVKQVTRHIQYGRLKPRRGHGTI